MKPVTRTIKSGQYLFHENDRSRELYVLQAGKVRVYKRINGKEIDLAILGKGAVLGEMALIEGKPRSASAKVLEDCTVVQIEAESIQDRIKGVPQWFHTMVKILSQKLRQTNSKIEAVSSERQGAALIVTLGYLFNEAKNKPLMWKVAELKLVQLLGSTYLKTAAMLENLCSREFVELRNGQIYLKNADEFENYCRYLRFLLRGAFKDFPDFHSGLFSLATEAAELFPSMINRDDTFFLINGDNLWALYLQCDLRDVHSQITDKLMNEGFLAFEKRLSNCQIEHPFSRSLLRLNNPGWMKLALYQKFKDADPTV